MTDQVYQKLGVWCHYFQLHNLSGRFDLPDLKLFLKPYLITYLSRPCPQNSHGVETMYRASDLSTYFLTRLFHWPVWQDSQVVWHDWQAVWHDWQVVWHVRQVVWHDWQVVWHDWQVVWHYWHVVWHVWQVVWHDWQVVWHDWQVVWKYWQVGWHDWQVSQFPYKSWTLLARGLSLYRAFFLSVPPLKVTRVRLKSQYNQSSSVKIFLLAGNWIGEKIVFKIVFSLILCPITTTYISTWSIPIQSQITISKVDLI